MSADSEGRRQRLTLDQVDELFTGDQPNWAAIEFDLLCPRCGYNLRHLPAPRCPECGLTFDWRLLVTRNVDRADIVFEHAWRRRLFLSWLMTFAMTFRPRILWGKIGLYDEIRVGPLFAFLSTAVLAIFLAAHALASTVVRIAYVLFPTVPVGWPTGLRNWLWQYPKLQQLWLFGNWPIVGDPRYVLVPLGAFLGLAGAGLVLAVMQQTLGRCRVRGIQLVRVIAYVAPPVVAISVAVILVFVLSLPRGIFVGRIPLVPNESYFVQAPIWQWCILGGGVLLILGSYAYLLASALRGYLKLPRAGFVAVISSFVAGLFAYTLLVRFGLEFLAK